MTRPFQIVRFNYAEDTSKVLASYATYDAADEALDGWCNRFPHAYIDIIEKGND
jgi:hypothetical protein